MSSGRGTRRAWPCQYSREDDASLAASAFRCVARRQRALKVLGRSMDTLTGPLSGRAALVQIIVVPALLMLCLVGIAVALALAR